MDDPVTIERDHLEILLWHAQKDDLSPRRWRTRFRRVPVCSEGKGLDPSSPEWSCPACQAFDAAKKAVGEKRLEDWW